VEGNNTRVPVAKVHASKENIVIMVHLIIALSQEDRKEVKRAQVYRIKYV
jgi:hypothetical protein